MKPLSLGPANLPGADACDIEAEEGRKAAGQLIQIMKKVLAAALFADVLEIAGTPLPTLAMPSPLYTHVVMHPKAADIRGDVHFVLDESINLETDICALRIGAPWTGKPSFSFSLGEIILGVAKGKSSRKSPKHSKGKTAK